MSFDDVKGTVTRYWKVTIVDPSLNTKFDLLDNDLLVFTFTTSGMTSNPDKIVRIRAGAPRLDWCPSYAFNGGTGVATGSHGIHSFVIRFAGGHHTGEDPTVGGRSTAVVWMADEG